MTSSVHQWPVAGKDQGSSRIAASVGIEGAQSHVEAHSWLGGREDLADTASSEAQKKAKGLNGDEKLLGSIWSVSEVFQM